MAGQTESLSVPSEEPATQQAGGEGCAEEEVVASVETGEPNSNFIISAASDDSMEGGKLAKNVESEEVGVIEEERPAEIEDEFASNDNVAEETVVETPMETEDIPRRVEEISETAIQEEESMAETNIPEEMNTEGPPKADAGSFGYLCFWCPSIPGSVPPPYSRHPAFYTFTCRKSRYLSLYHHHHRQGWICTQPGSSFFHVVQTFQM